jgi:rod shape-determining protein MreC
MICYQMQEFMLRIKNRVVAVVLFTIISFFVFRHCAFVGVSTVGALSSCLVYPFLRIQQCIIAPIKVWLGRRVTIQELEKIVELIQKENDVLVAENISLKAMRYYADETSELRDFNKRYMLKKGRIVHVLARHFSPNNQFFLMDAGSRHGIKKDMIAMYCNCIVGRVCEVYPWYCKIYLITDAECKVAAMCEQTGASGIHEGLNDNTHTVLRHVSHLEKITSNSLVLSSGEGLIFPSGFALGKIASVRKGDLFYSIDVKPILDFNALSYCTLIAKDEIETTSLK